MLCDLCESRVLGIADFAVKNKIGIRQILLDLLENIIQMKNIFDEKT